MIKEMKGKTLRMFVLPALMLLFVVPAFSQTPMGSKDVGNEDSLQCLRSISTYREFLKHDLYGYAMESWRQTFDNCPAYSVMIYVDGVSLYRSYIEKTPNGPVREGLIDTLMLIYDRRMEYFGGEGNVLGRKGKDLLNYRRGDTEQVQEAYEMLKRSIELEGEKSQESVMQLFMSAGVALNKGGKLDDNQVLENYFMLVGILDQLEGTSSRWARTRASVDEIMLKTDILSCEALNRYFEPQFEQNRDDKVFLEKVMSFYTNTGCYLSDIYEAASENLYRIEPGPESAHNLAILYISRSNFPKAASYLKLAVIGENIDNETRAQWFYELALVSSANEAYCEAVNYAREAIANNSNFGKAYMALGDAIVAARTNLGDDLHQRAAYWAAADKYAKAASLDRSLEADVNRKITDYAGQYPDNEDVFFLDLKVGDTYLVGGCINEYTTVRSRK